MELLRKNITIIRLQDITTTVKDYEDATDFRFRKDVTDRLSSMKPSKLIILHDKNEKDFLPMLKAIEIFLFVKCKTAVFCVHYGSAAYQVIARDREKVVTTDRKAAEELGADYVELSTLLG